VKKNSKTPRFDVDYAERLKQSRDASNAYRLPRLGYELYRIYVIEQPKKESSVSAGWYGSSGGQNSHTITVSKSRQSGKSQANWQAVLWAFIDELETKIEPAYEVKWLKPKQTTLLRMRGHRVEPAQPGDRVGHVGPLDKPVRLGR
jgi:hypothetical protein